MTTAVLWPLIIATVSLCIILGVLVYLFVEKADEYDRIRRENKDLHRLLEKKAKLDSDCLNAYCAMLREASRSRHDHLG